jgi:hypothetical protein
VKKYNFIVNSLRFLRDIMREGSALLKGKLISLQRKVEGFSRILEYSGNL